MVESARSFKYVSVEEYLEAELNSPTKSEYLGGVVYAMAGARNAHNQIAVNLLVALANRLRGQSCRAFNSDTKIRIRLPDHVRFYYPDVSVVCRPNPGSDSFQDEPVLVAEVLSQRTRRLDDGEKKEGYLRLPSLSTYLLVEQECALVIAYRRTDLGFVRELYEGPSATLALPDPKLEIPLAELYDGVEFSPED